jgi:hypothetical protein
MTTPPISPIRISSSPDSEVAMFLSEKSPIEREITALHVLRFSLAIKKLKDFFLKTLPFNVRLRKRDGFSRQICNFIKEWAAECHDRPTIIEYRSEDFKSMARKVDGFLKRCRKDRLPVLPSCERSLSTFSDILEDCRSSSPLPPIFSDSEGLRVPRRLWKAMKHKDPLEIEIFELYCRAYVIAKQELRSHPSSQAEKYLRKCYRRALGIGVPVFPGSERAIVAFRSKLHQQGSALSPVSCTLP